MALKRINLNGAEINLPSKVSDLEDDLNLASKGDVQGRLFIGTQEEYNTAYSEGKIQIGALVIILNEADNESDVIALLGKAILGKMILGTN